MGHEKSPQSVCMGEPRLAHTHTTNLPPGVFRAESPEKKQEWHVGLMACKE